MRHLKFLLYGLWLILSRLVLPGSLLIVAVWGTMIGGTLLIRHFSGLTFDQIEAIFARICLVVMLFTGAYAWGRSWLEEEK